MTILSEWAHYDARQDLWTLQIHVQPGARATCVVGEYGSRLKLKIAAPAVDNKANKYLAEFLSKAFGVAIRQVCITQGEMARQKTVTIKGAGNQMPGVLEQNNKK